MHHLPDGAEVRLKPGIAEQTREDLLPLGEQAQERAPIVGRTVHRSLGDGIRATSNGHGQQGSRQRRRFRRGDHARWKERLGRRRKRGRELSPTSVDRGDHGIATEERGGKRRPSVLAGPTCDSIDVVNDHVDLPELRAGDLVVGHMMGAYTWASATDFNFFPKARLVAVNLTPGERGSVIEVNR